MMDRTILGDNPFFAVNHLSDERSRAQAIRFKDNQAIIDVLDQAMECGVNTFMCTTHDRIAAICAHMRKNPARYAEFKFFPCMPYAHKYANAVTELGILGTLQAYIPGNIFAVGGKAGLAWLRKDFASLMELLVDAEMKMFEGMNTPVIFLQNAFSERRILAFDSTSLLMLFPCFHLQIRMPFDLINNDQISIPQRIQRLRNFLRRYIPQWKQL